MPANRKQSQTQLTLFDCQTLDKRSRLADDSTDHSKEHLEQDSGYDKCHDSQYSDWPQESFDSCSSSEDELSDTEEDHGRYVTVADTPGLGKHEQDNKY